MNLRLLLIFLASVVALNSISDFNKEHSTKFYDKSPPVLSSMRQNRFLSMPEPPTEVFLGTEPIEVIVPPPLEVYVWRLTGFYKATVTGKHQFSIYDTKFAIINVGPKYPEPWDFNEKTYSEGDIFSGDSPKEVFLEEGNYYPVVVTYVSWAERVPVFVTIPRGVMMVLNGEIQQLDSGFGLAGNIDNSKLSSTQSPRFTLSGFYYNVFLFPPGKSHEAVLRDHSKLQKISKGFLDSPTVNFELDMAQSPRIIEIVGHFKPPRDDEYRIRLTDLFISSLQIGPGMEHKEDTYTVDHNWKLLDNRVESSANFELQSKFYYPFRIVVFGSGEDFHWDISSQDSSGSEVDLFSLWAKQIPSDPSLLETNNMDDTLNSESPESFTSTPEVIIETSPDFLTEPPGSDVMDLNPGSNSEVLENANVSLEVDDPHESLTGTLSPDIPELRNGSTSNLPGIPDTVSIENVLGNSFGPSFEASGLFPKEDIGSSQDNSDKIFSKSFDIVDNTEESNSSIEPDPVFVDSKQVFTGMRKEDSITGFDPILVNLQDPPENQEPFKNHSIIEVSSVDALEPKWEVSPSSVFPSSASSIYNFLSEIEAPVVSSMPGFLGNGTSCSISAKITSLSKPIRNFSEDNSAQKSYHDSTEIVTSNAPTQFSHTASFLGTLMSSYSSTSDIPSSVQKNSFTDDVFENCYDINIDRPEVNSVCRHHWDYGSEILGEYNEPLNSICVSLKLRPPFDSKNEKFDSRICQPLPNQKETLRESTRAKVGTLDRFPQNREESPAFTNPVPDWEDFVADEGDFAGLEKMNENIKEKHGSGSSTYLADDGQAPKSALSNLLPETQSGNFPHFPAEQDGDDFLEFPGSHHPDFFQEIGAESPIEKFEKFIATETPSSTFGGGGVALKISVSFIVGIHGLLVFFL